MRPPQVNEVRSATKDWLAGNAEEDGYVHTLREILQQPAMWVDTCERLIARREALKKRLTGIGGLVLTGSGSSQFAGECVRAVLQRERGIGVEVIDGGALVTHGPGAMAPARPALVVSLARSGNSPESVGVVSLLLEAESQVNHLVLTCNGDGRLVRTHMSDSRVEAVILDPRTNDRSLVMTSSFTNLVLAARFLGLVNEPERYRSICGILAKACSDLLDRHFGSLERIARGRFDRVVYLASDPDRGAMRECSLKMLEMTAGRVATMSETYLGLRHGPMSFIDERTLVVCFLSADAHLREYESDLIRELNRKELGAMKLVAGEQIDAGLLLEGDEAIEIPGMAEAGDDNTPVLQVVVGQLLAFFRCIGEGLKPDSPSENGIISRVVEEFPIHRRGSEQKR
jgi:tagatose-6-phosphate ketose/aldose isomerase